MATSGEVNQGYYPNAADDDDKQSKESNDEQQSVDTETVDQVDQQCSDLQDDNNLEKETISVLTSLHSPCRIQPSTLNHPPTSDQALALPCSEITVSTLQDISSYINPTSQPSNLQSLDISPHQQHQHSTTMTSPYNPSLHSNFHSQTQQYPSPYPLPYLSPPPYQLISTQDPVTNTYDPTHPNTYELPTLPPSYEVAVGSSSSSAVVFTIPSESHRLNDDLIACRPSLSFRTEMLLSCFTLWFCGVVFGLIAFILASTAIDRAQSRREHEAKQLGKASVTVSMVGMLCGLILIIILATSLGVRPSYSTSPGRGSGRPNQCYCQPSWYGYYGYYNCDDCYKSTPATPKCYCQRFSGDTYLNRNCGECLQRTTTPSGGSCYCRSYAYGTMDYRPCRTCY